MPVIKYRRIGNLCSITSLIRISQGRKDIRINRKSVSSKKRLKSIRCISPVVSFLFLCPLACPFRTVLPFIKMNKPACKNVLLRGNACAGICLLTAFCDYMHILFAFFFFDKSCILFFGKARARQARTLAFSLCLPHPCDGKGIIIIIYGSEPPCTARQCALRDWRRGVFDVRADWRSLTLRFGQTIFGLRITEILLHILNFTNEAKDVEVLCFDCETTDSLLN